MYDWILVGFTRRKFLTLFSVSSQMSSPMNLIVLVMLTFAALAPLVSAQTCPVEDKLRVTVTLPPAFGFYNLLDVTADPADVDFNNRQCCRDCRSTPFAVRVQKYHI